MKFSKSTAEPTRVLSMYYQAPIWYKDQLFDSAVHLLSWHKSKDVMYREHINQCDSMQAGFYGTQMGRNFLSRHRDSSRIELRKDWPAIADKTVRRILRLKLEQNPVILQILLDTDNQVLIENDKPVYWDIDVPKNKLGKMWMKIRRDRQQ